ncbi:MAG: YbhB/YbcL family Raf kinase inhibitor-like protein [Magnetococcales bacterium]|nr:YbhB/YbcL family Raf kinase inhibitor-like protein [Magnetococcales bacterium]
MKRAIMAGVLALGVAGAAGAGEMRLTSPAFLQGGSIPPEFTCDGADRSPPLYWTGLPEGVKTLALIVDDPDAPGGTWVHWVVYNIPATLDGMAAGALPMPQLSTGAIQGGNDFRRIGYGGPCPPSGAPHHYQFRLYALNAELPFAMALGRQQLLKQMEGRILGQAELMGTYQRHKP